MKKILPLVFILFIQLWIYNIHAGSTFGISCSTLPKGDNSGYLINDTAYGFLVSNIDMIANVPNGCDVGDNILRFCINTSATQAVCTQVQMNAGTALKLSDISTAPYLGGNPLLADISLSADIIGNSLCLQMPTSRGVMPLMCRNYVSPTTQTIEDQVCQNLGASCYDGRSKSQSLLSFSGITVNCVRETLDKVFYTGNQCPQVTDDITFSYLRPFPEFQQALRLTVTAMLILYVIFYGFKLSLDGEYGNLNKVATFVLKFLFVVYFSVGFVQSYDQTGAPISNSGMTTQVLPLLLQATSDFTEIVFNSGGSQGLCQYDKSKYQAGYGFYAVWDAIDCRIGYYLGMQLLYNYSTAGLGTAESGNSNSGNSNNAANFTNNGGGTKDLKKPETFAFFIAMFGFFMAGNIIIVICGIVFVAMFISVIFYFLSIYLVSMVTLYVMVYISPIFVPLVLFERTKNYFESWLKIVVSCVLQPVVVGGFIALLLTLYDSIFYGNCEYLRHDYESSGFNFSTFEIREPASEPEKCTSSPGYKLMQYYLGNGWDRKIAIFFEIVTLDDVFNLGMGMAYTLVYIFIFYFALQSVNEFISDLTGGPSMGSVTISPTAFAEAAFNAAKKGVSAIQNMKSGGAAKGGEGGGAKRGGSSPGAGGGGGGGAGDKASTGGGGAAADKASGGG